MQDQTSDRLVLSAPAQNLLRILIASYFLAGAIGLIPGSDLTPLFGRVLPEQIAGPSAACFVFVLSYLVMIGVWLRGAALTLAIVTFWASYLRMMDMGIADELGGFWRDLALIASLMLTYAETDPKNREKRAPLRCEPSDADVDPHPQVRPRQPAAARPLPDGPTDQTGSPVVRHDHLRQPVSSEELEHIFREEFRQARTS